MFSSPLISLPFFQISGCARLARMKETENILVSGWFSAQCACVFCLFVCLFACLLVCWGCLSFLVIVRPGTASNLLVEAKR